MTNVNMQNLFSLFILVSLVRGIRSQWDYVTEQREIASKPCRESNSNESQNKADMMSTAAISLDNEKFDDYELKKLFVKKFKLYKNSGSAKYSNESLTIRPQRKTRGVLFSSTIMCRTCYAVGKSREDEECYQGFKAPLKKCADAEQCFTEIHPDYMKRGCILPGRVNKTFVCKCPLCNDKPSTESSNYEYMSINDWAYDNNRLSKRLLGMDLICKVCETKGADPVQDRSCRSGKNTEYMVCPHNYLCYTNIDDEVDSVSRGCISRPAFNSIFHFCNTSACNTHAYVRPKLRIQRDDISGRQPQTNLKSADEMLTKNSVKQSRNLSLTMLLLGMTYCLN